MERRPLRRLAKAYLGLGLVFATTVPCDAQTWTWKYVTRIPNTPPVAAQSTVVVTAGKLRLSYTVPLRNRQVVIELCHAALSDVEQASTVRTHGPTYLLLRLKPAHAASCASGLRPAVALPADDEPYVSSVAAAINRSCCTVARTTPRPAALSAKDRSAAAATSAPSPSPAAAAVPVADPSPAAAAVPVASPSPAAAAVPVASPPPAPAASLASAVRVDDWVETAGLFAFVRVRNRGAARVTISAANLIDCRNVDAGCGPVKRTSVLDPGSVATLATIASTNERNVPAFGYRYTASDGRTALARSGSSAERPLHQTPRMSEQELRTAEAAALGGLRMAPRVPQMTATAARLTKRGSSRLAIGETGTAIVRLMIAANGTPEQAVIVSITNRRLSAAAIETAVSSTYAPAMENGKPVTANYVATFSFNGEDPALATIPVWKRSPAPAVSGTPLPLPSVPPPTSAPPSPSPSR